MGKMTKRHISEWTKGSPVGGLSFGAACFAIDIPAAHQIDDAIELLTFGPVHSATLRFFSTVGAAIRHGPAESVLVPTFRAGPSVVDAESWLALDVSAPFHLIAGFRFAPWLDLVAGDHLGAGLANRLGVLVAKLAGDEAVGVLPMLGLDAEDAVVMARAPRLDTVIRLDRAIRALVVADVIDDGAFSAAVDRLDAASRRALCPDDAAVEALAASSLWSASRTSVGVPTAMLAGSTPVDLDAVAAVAACVRCRIGPDAAPDVAAAILAAAPGGARAVDVDGGDTIVFASSDGPRPWHVGELLALLAPALHSTGFQVDISVCDEFAPARPLALAGPSAQVRARWLDKSASWTSRLREAAVRHEWSDSQTRAALGVAESLGAEFAKGRALELVEPAQMWIQRALDAVAPDGEAFAVLAEAAATPSRLRAFFDAWLSEVSAARGLDCSPVVAPGLEPVVGIEPLLDTAVFRIDTTRLSQPATWPALASEIERLRLARLPPSDRWILPLRRWFEALHRYPPRVPVAIPDSGPSARDHGAFALELARGVDFLRGHARWFDGDAEWTPWHTFGTVADALPEIACDIAVADAGVLGPTPSASRYLATMWPHRALELRAQLRGAGPSERELAQSAIALRQLFEFVSWSALAARNPGARIGGALEAELRGPWLDATAATRALLIEAARDSGNVGWSCERRPPAVVCASIDAAVARAARHLAALGADDGARRVWASGLTALHAVRRGSETTGPAIAVVARILGAVLDPACLDADAAARSSEAAPHPPLVPGRGLDPESAAGRRQSDALHALAVDGRDAVRRCRLRGLEAARCATLPAPLEPTPAPATPIADDLAAIRATWNTPLILLVEHGGRHGRDRSPWELDLIWAAWSASCEVVGVERFGRRPTGEPLAPGLARSREGRAHAPDRRDVEGLWRVSRALRAAARRSRGEPARLRIIGFDPAPGASAWAMELHPGAGFVPADESAPALRYRTLVACVTALLEARGGDPSPRRPTQSWAYGVREIAAGTEAHSMIARVIAAWAPARCGPSIEGEPRS